ncbi:MAG: YkgJ family cysteine cluster protein [Halobacteriaceae archaeon]
MRTDCEGCAGCCVDWRPLAPTLPDRERRGRYRPVDDTYNLAVCSRSDVRRFLEAGHADALVPRLFRAEAGVDVGGETLAAVDGRAAFLVGLRKVPKPVAPFDVDPRWLDACVFLDPETLQCRIHDDPLYPEDCADYPGHDLLFDRETECERVEAHVGGTRLLDDDPPESFRGLRFGRQALGEKVFVAPESVDEAVLTRLVDGSATDDDRARLVAAAAASAPGTATVAGARFDDALDAARDADSWVGRAAADWRDRAESGARPIPGLGEAVEEDRGAPPTPGWS